MSLAVCVIGNSHTAAIKQAWDRSDFARPKGLSLTFFAAGNASMEELRFRSGKLIPRTAKLERKFLATSGGSTSIDIANYDAFFLIGFEFGVDLTKICGELGTPGDLDVGPVKQLVSRQCFRACFRRSLDDSLSVTLMQRIRSVSEKPILIFPVPFPPAHVLASEDAPSHPGFGNPAFLEDLVSRLKAVANQVALEHGAAIVWQDEATTERSGFTKAAFSIGAARNNAHNENHDADRFHMNPDYGAIALSRALQRLNDAR